jgi:hypothetical protein
VDHLFVILCVRRGQKSVMEATPVRAKLVRWVQVLGYFFVGLRADENFAMCGV